MEVENTKSYKALGGYITILFITSSLIFSCYSFIKVLIDPVIFIDPTHTDFNLIKKCNITFTLNIITIISTIQYIIMILITICDCFNYNISKVIYRIFYSSYIITHIISCSAFAINTKCFDFFKDNYNYYYVSVIIQFLVCLFSIIPEFLDWLCCSSCEADYECVCCMGCDCFEKSDKENESGCVCYNECCNLFSCSKENKNENDKLLNH